MVNLLTQHTTLLFESIIGQEIPKKIVEGFYKNKKFPSTMIFWGPPGVGKFTLSVEIGSLLTNKKESIMKNIFPDFIVLFPHFKDMEYSDVFNYKIKGMYHLIHDEPGNILIEDIREIIRNSSMTTYEGGWRVFVIVQAERITDEAMQAFLKLLEEPVSKNIFILITEHKNYLPETIRSRGTDIRFHPLRKEEMREILKRKGEKINENLFEHSRGIEDYMFLKDNVDLMEKLYNLFFEKNGEERLKYYKDIEGISAYLIINLLMRILDNRREEMGIEDIERKIKLLTDAKFFLDRNVNEQNVIRFLLMEV